MNNGFQQMWAEIKTLWNYAFNIDIEHPWVIPLIRVTVCQPRVRECDHWPSQLWHQYLDWLLVAPISDQLPREGVMCEHFPLWYDHLCAKAEFKKQTHTMLYSRIQKTRTRTLYILNCKLNTLCVCITSCCKNMLQIKAGCTESFMSTQVLLWMENVKLTSRRHF